jgi:hypothetical protein
MKKPVCAYDFPALCAPGAIQEQNMLKSLVAVAVAIAISVPVAAQTAPQANQAPAAKPQTVKKRVCEQVDEDPYSRLGARKICRTIEVPVQAPQAGSTNGQQAPAASSANGNSL